jgi:riboflavin transporter FmnP
VSSGHRSRRIALVAVFTAMAVDLSPISIPDPFASYLLFGVWEIPVVIAFLMLGVWGGSAVAGLNALVLEAVKPGALPTGPLYNLIAELSMFAGILFALSASRRSAWGLPAAFVLATACGAASRVVAMTVVNAIVLPMPYPVGFGSFGVTWVQLPVLLPAIAAFNLVVALYTIPIALGVHRAASTRLGPGAG